MKPIGEKILSEKKPNPALGFWRSSAFRTLIFCFLSAVICWLLISLSEESSLTIKKQVEYTGLPKGMVLTTALPDFFTMNVKASGFALIANHFRDRDKALLINISEVWDQKKQNSANEFNIPSHVLIPQLSLQLNSGIQILTVNPENLNLNFGSRMSKKLAVLPDLSLSFKKNFRQNGPWILNPDSVVISGSEDELKSIQTIRTKPLSLKNLDKSVHTICSISIPGNFSCNPEQVYIDIPVEQFTTFDGFVEVKSVTSAGLNVKLVPSRVRLSCVISLDGFKSMQKNPILAEVNLKNVSGSGKAEVLLKNLPAGAKNIRIEPSEIDFLFIK